MYGRDSCFCPPATRGHGTMSIGEASMHTGRRYSQVGTASRISQPATLSKGTPIQCWRDAGTMIVQETGDSSQTSASGGQERRVSRSSRSPDRADTFSPSHVIICEPLDVRSHTQGYRLLACSCRWDGELYSNNGSSSLCFDTPQIHKT